MSLYSLNASEEIQFELQLDKQRIYGILATFVPYVVVPLFLLVIGIGFFGNLLVVLVVALNKNMRNTTNLLILNLAIADILFIVFCVPFTAVDYYFASIWPFGDTWCRFVQFLIINTAFVSIYTLVFMAADRFVAVVLPVLSKTIRTVRRTKQVLVFIWALTSLLAVPAALAHGTIPLGNKVDFLNQSTVQYSCQYLEEFEMPWVVFQSYFFVLGYFLPLILIVILYSIMLYKLLQQGPGGHSSREQMKNKKRVVRLVVSVTVVFAISWLPIQSILLLKSRSLYPVTVSNILFQILSHVLAYSNSCMNPILYAFLSTSFRSGFLKLIQCSGPRLPPAGVENNHLQSLNKSQNKKVDQDLHRPLKDSVGEQANNGEEQSTPLITGSPQQEHVTEEGPRGLMVTNGDNETKTKLVVENNTETKENPQNEQSSKT